MGNGVIAESGGDFRGKSVCVGGAVGDEGCHGVTYGGELLMPGQVGLGAVEMDDVLAGSKVLGKVCCKGRAIRIARVGNAKAGTGSGTGGGGTDAGGFHAGKWTARGVATGEDKQRGAGGNGGVERFDMADGEGKNVGDALGAENGQRLGELRGRAGQKNHSSVLIQLGARIYQKDWGYRIELQEGVVYGRFK